MVLAYYPQQMQRSLSTNSNYPPQGVGGVAPPVQENPLLAIYPPIADNTFQFYKFYQIKKNQVPTTQTNMPLVIIDTVGSGIFQQASGFDIRAFDSTGSPLNYEVQSITTGPGDFIIWIDVTTVKDSEFVQLTFGKASATDGSNRFAVWSEYESVYHLNNVPGGVGSILDSTVQQNNGTPTGTATIAAKIGQGLELNVPPTDTDKIDISNSRINFDYTISILFKTTQTTLGDLFSLSDGGQFGVLIEKLTDGRIRYLFGEIGGSSVNLNSTTAGLDDDVFHILHMTV